MSDRRCFEDHGNAYRSEGPSIGYCEPPVISAVPDTTVSRLAYEMQENAESAAIHAQRLERLTSRINAREAAAGTELSAAMKRCHDALAQAIINLKG